MADSNRVRTLWASMGFATVLLALVTSTGCQREAQSTQRTNNARIATRTVAVPVNGMICQICAGQVKSALKAVHGVEDVEISLENRNATIRYADGQLNVDQVTRAITDLGYKTGPPMHVETQ